MHPVVVGMQVDEKKNDEREKERKRYIYIEYNVWEGKKDRRERVRLRKKNN